MSSLPYANWAMTAKQQRSLDALVCERVSRHPDENDRFLMTYWTDFPPRVINPTKENWMRHSSQIPPVPVGKKPANELGLYDMLGRERELDELNGFWGRDTGVLITCRGHGKTNVILFNWKYTIAYYIHKKVIGIANYY